MWIAYDCSEEEPAEEKLAVRLKTVEDATKFKEAFEAARVFNGLLKEGKTEDLVHAPVIEDVPDQTEEDDACENKPAETS